MHEKNSRAIWMNRRVIYVHKCRYTNGDDFGFSFKVVCESCVCFFLVVENFVSVPSDSILFHPSTDAANKCLLYKYRKSLRFLM